MNALNLFDCKVSDIEYFHCLHLSPSEPGTCAGAAGRRVQPAASPTLRVEL